MKLNVNEKIVNILSYDNRKNLEKEGGVVGMNQPDFFRIAISSHICVQMGRELVRLIGLIHLNMFSTHINGIT